MAEDVHIPFVMDVKSVRVLTAEEAAAEREAAKDVPLGPHDVILPIKGAENLRYSPGLQDEINRAQRAFDRRQAAEASRAALARDARGRYIPPGTPPLLRKLYRNMLPSPNDPRPENFTPDDATPDDAPDRSGPTALGGLRSRYPRLFRSRQPSAPSTGDDPPQAAPSQDAAMSSDGIDAETLSQPAAPSPSTGDAHGTRSKANRGDQSSSIQSSRVEGAEQATSSAGDQPPTSHELAGALAKAAEPEKTSRNISAPDPRGDSDPITPTTPFVDDDGHPVLDYLGLPTLRPAGQLDPHSIIAKGRALKQAASSANDVSEYEGFVAATYANLANFKSHGPWDAQRLDSAKSDPFLVDYANMLIGIYGKAAGLPLNTVLEIANTYAKIYKPQYGDAAMDRVYTTLSLQDADDIRIGYASVSAEGRIKYDPQWQDGKG